MRTRSIQPRGALVVLAALALPGCSDDALGPLHELPRALTPAETEVVEAANDFGLDLFARLAADRPRGNVFFSPLSAYMALGMTANGAAGETLDAMRATLRQAGVAEDEANAAYRGLLDLFLGLDPRVRFEIANSIWYRLGLAVHPEFVDLSRSVFDARVTELDFDDPAAPGVINAWVEERTSGRIRELVQSLSPQDLALLINAIYFKGTWQHQFDPNRTRDASFRLPDGSHADVPTMVRDRVELLRHQRRDGFEAAELLYGRGAYVMTIVLPSEGTLPSELMAGVDAAIWDGWMEGFEDTDAIDEVRLPKFRLEWEKLLNDELTAMGMGVAFGPADFSRLAEGGEGFFISKVRQKTFVEVNEEGTEAAAVTSVNIADRGRPTFRADRPFLFAIRERFSGAILFLGQLVDPTAL